MKKMDFRHPGKTLANGIKIRETGKHGNNGIVAKNKWGRKRNTTAITTTSCVTGQLFHSYSILAQVPTENLLAFQFFTG